jgi:hypothetical protein
VTVISQKMQKEIGAAIAALVLLFVAIAPADCTSNVVLGGSAAGWAILSAGNPAASSLVSAPGITNGSAVFAPTNTADGFTDTINFGTLSNGNGTESVASVALRQRGNMPCHVSCSVSTFTANNIAYNGTPLTGAGSELSFVRLGAGAQTNGLLGNDSGFSYGGRFTSGSDTLATLNNGVIAPVNGSKDKFCSFTSAPSFLGGPTSILNYVQDVAVFRIPTGWVWSTTGPAPNNWSVTLQFGIYANP